ncbi:hypothetical protein MASR2M70_05570 [Bacillota bacterium]
MCDLFKPARINIVTGHYGSGKTEFAVNYALKLAENSTGVSVVDLDIVNPYFRARELSTMLKAKGIRVISSSVDSPSVEVPALSAEIFSAFTKEALPVIFDVGGDGAGANALARYHKYLDKAAYEMFFVLNANRHATGNPHDAIRYIQSIEEASKQKITSIVNNTHMCGETTADDIVKGQKLCLEISEITGLPIRYTVISKMLLNEQLCSTVKNELFPIDIYLKKPWES